MGDPIDRPATAQSGVRFPISWNDLRAFLAVSVHGSMNRAAEELGESQPTIGRRMRRLERIPTPRAALRWVMQIVEHCTYGQSYEQDFRSA